MMSVKYVKKYILGIKKHYKEFYSLIEKDYDYLSSDKTINLIIKIYEKIIQCGSLSKKFYGDFIKCCLYGLKNKELKLFSMCSNSLTAVPHILRDKIQYKKIFELKNFFSQISRDLRIKISYICILPDYDKKYNLNFFDSSWNDNVAQINRVSGVMTFRLSKITHIPYEKYKSNILIDFKLRNELLKKIDYYTNNQFWF